MGGGKGRKDQTTLSQVPISTNIVDNRIKTLQLKDQNMLLAKLRNSWRTGVSRIDFHQPTTQELISEQN